MFIKSPLTMVLFVLLVFLTSFLLSCRRRNVFLIGPSAGIAGFIFIYKFYSLLSDVNNPPGYLNPFSLIILCATIPLGVFVTLFALKQLRLVFMGLTTKQYDAISKEAIMELERIDNRYKINKNMSIREKISNLINFLKRGYSDSLIKFY